VFDLSYIPQGTPITSAAFTMSVGGTQPIRGAPIALAISDYVAPSSVLSQATFPQVQPTVNPPANLGQIGNLPVTAPPGSINIVQTFDVTSFVRALVNNGTFNAGFLFECVGDAAISIPGSTAPSLTVTSPVTLAVPEPNSSLVLAIGLIGVGLVAHAARR
jgi:hypothetical protein